MTARRTGWLADPGLDTPLVAASPPGAVVTATVTSPGLPPSLLRQGSPEPPHPNQGKTGHEDTSFEIPDAAPAAAEEHYC